MKTPRFWILVMGFGWALMACVVLLYSADQKDDYERARAGEFTDVSWRIDPGLNAENAIRLGHHPMGDGPHWWSDLVYIQEWSTTGSARIVLTRHMGVESEPGQYVDVHEILIEMGEQGSISVSARGKRSVVGSEEALWPWMRIDGTVTFSRLPSGPDAEPLAVRWEFVVEQYGSPQNVRQTVVL